MNLLKPSPEAIEALVPTGTLRAAINLSNFLLVSRVDVNGTPYGVSPGMSMALAEQLGAELSLHTYKDPGDVADAATAGEWDIGNIGAEKARAEVINFSAAYAEIESTYLVPEGSPIRSVEEVDQPGVVIAVKARAAYSLWLEENLHHAELVLTDTVEASFDLFVERELQALAGLRTQLLQDALRLPGSCVLEGTFRSVQQAIGTPKDRHPAGIEYLNAFVEAAKTDGLVRDLIEQYGVEGLSVAPPSPKHLIS